MQSPVVNAVWAKIYSIYRRITLSRVTLAFFIFTFLHCFVQSLVQSVLFSLDDDANTLASTIVAAAEVPSRNFAWLMRHNDFYNLQLCSDIPHGQPDSPCVTVFKTGTQITTIPSGFRRRDNATTGTTQGPITQVTGSGNAGTSMQPLLNSSGSVLGVEVSMHGAPAVELDLQCTRVLVYAAMVLNNSRREELALIGSEFWLFGISVFAIIYDSTPHLIAALFMRVLSSGWSAYSIWRTKDIATRFSTLITGTQSSPGACGIDLFPTYFTQRLPWQVADVVLNIMTLVVTALLTHSLVKTYCSFMFTSVGAPKHIVRIYRFFLGVFVCLQLSVFLIVASASLWVDELVNSALASVSSHTTVYLALFISTLILLLPWLATGWFAVRHEMKRAMLFYLTTGFALLVCWAIMYYSLVYRWTWVQWPFFASLTVAAQLVLTASIILGVICWRHFGHGLAHFLHVEQVLEKSDFEPESFPHDTKDKGELYLYLDFNTIPKAVQPPDYASYIFSDDHRDEDCEKASVISINRPSDAHFAGGKGARENMV